MSDPRKGPHFIGIGAQRAATTWLYRVLDDHPDIWFTPRKEIHYFDRRPMYPSYSHLSLGFLDRFLKKSQAGRDWRRLFRIHIDRVLNEKNHDTRMARLAWFWKYSFGKYDDVWYLDLFAGNQAKLAGEITPAYAMLTKKHIKNVHEILPDLKIIFLLRNPIERAWSQIQYTKQRTHLSYAANELLKIASRKGVLLRGNYIRTIDNWLTFYPKEQFFIGYYDDVLKNPRRLIGEVCQFLGVRDQCNSDYFSQKVNETKSSSIPDNIRGMLASKYVAMLEELSGRYGGYATEWYQQAEKIVTAQTK